MVKRIVAIILIFLATSIAWMILGGTIRSRTYDQTGKLYERVEDLWGSSHVQEAPMIYSETERQKRAKKNDGTMETITEITRNNVGLEASDISVDFDLSHRKKGLLWYDTYKVNFQAKYLIKNPSPRQESFKVAFSFPAQNAVYDNFRLTVNGKPVEINDFSQKTITIPLPLKAHEEGTLEIGYLSQGMDQWHYSFGKNVSRVKNFSLAMTTNFADIDFPQNTISPSIKGKTPSGWRLKWQYQNLISGFQIGMDMPNKLNPGPLASRISFFAPVSLLFFFFVVFMFSVIKNINIHPMHYFFLAAAFFAFHLLFAYTVDHLPIALAFLIASLVSMFLVISYVRVVVGSRFAILEAGISQFIFLVLFSLSHFFEGYTGLTVTIGAIFTLGVMMHLTANIDWEEKFKSALATKRKA